MAQEYQDFLQKKHAAFTTPETVLNYLIKAKTGHEPISKNRLILGEMNEVYDVSFPDHKPLIVRIGHSWEYRFGAEKWAIDQARKKGAAVPVVITAAEETIDGKKVAVSIQEKLPGEPLNFIIEKKDSEWTAKIVKAAGKELAKIHQVETHGFGFLNDQGMGEYQSWSDYMLSYQSGQSKLAGLASDNGIDTSLVEKATALLLKHRNLFAQVQPRLLHTDFSPKHILVNGDHITGLIDFENCKGGDNSFDFAWWDYFYRNQNHLKWLREGYQELGELGENFDLRLQLMKVYFGLMFLEWYGEQKNPAISHVKETFRVDIEALT